MFRLQRFVPKNLISRSVVSGMAATAAVQKSFYSSKPAFDDDFDDDDDFYYFQDMFEIGEDSDFFIPEDEARLLDREFSEGKK